MACVAASLNFLRLHLLVGRACTRFALLSTSPTLMCPTSSVLAFCLLAAEAGQSWLFSSFVCNQESEMERQTKVGF